MVVRLCEFCSFAPITPNITRCCKVFACDGCREKLEKQGQCLCGKLITKRLCMLNQQLFEVVDNYYSQKPQECFRCNQPAAFNCKECQMLFCQTCNAQVHNGVGFAKHSREPYIHQLHTANVDRAVEKIRRREDWCRQHKQPIESVCQCMAMLCAGCIRQHRETCVRVKLKSLKEWRQDYLAQILGKFKQITQYKERLKTDKQSYEEHFVKQREVHSACLKNIDEQLEGLKKLLQIKIEEIMKNLREYWGSCEAAFNKNVYLAETQLSAYDDYARLIEKFAENSLGLDYLDRKIKRILIPFDFYHFKSVGAEAVQSAILGFSAMWKNWENVCEANRNDDFASVKADKKQQLPAMCVSSQLLLECTRNPLQPRPMRLLAGHSEIHFQFLHLPYQEESYELEYGVGFKMKGEEVFKRVYNMVGVGLLEGLNPSTKYRVRMRVVGGSWSEIYQVKTLELPRFAINECNFVKNLSQNSFQLLRAGILYGSNEINFGNHSWTVKIVSSKGADDSETACISIGVSNKNAKRPVFVGTTLNYGYQREVILVRVTLSCQQKRLTVFNSVRGQEEVFQNLPQLPVYPTLQNKGNSAVQIKYAFNCQDESLL